MFKNPWLIIGVVALVAIGGSVVYSSNITKQANVGIEFSEHVLGNPDSEVVLVEYSDFQCPACLQFFPVVKDVLSEYGDQIRFEYKHFPLVTIHPYAVPAARASEAAGQQGQFFPMHDKIFENQSTWSNSSNPNVFFNQYAEELGLDMDLFKQHMRASVITDKIDAEFRQAQELGFTGTPTFTLNGERMTFQTFEEFVAQIETAIGVTPDTAGDESMEGAHGGDMSADDSAEEVQFGI